MSSEEESDLYTPYSQRPEWSDVIPIPQDDGPHPICPIMYSDEFKDKMNYFRAILKSKEKSLRVLKLLEDIVQDNPSNYTVWYYRREVLKSIENDTSIEYDIADEMQLLNEMGESDPKNYQIWNHRRFIIEKYIGASSIEAEKLFLSDVLNEDAKNYHAWSHRQWLLKTYKQWQGELEFVNKLLKLDHRNNSAWNHRFFVLLSTNGSGSSSGSDSNNNNNNNNSGIFSKELVNSEVEFALGYIKFSPNNESPWNYLRGLFKGQSLSNYKDLLNQLLELKSKYIGCSHVNSIILDFYQEENTKQSLEESLKICKLLSETIDPIHKKYWEFKYNTIENKLKTL